MARDSDAFRRGFERGRIYYQQTSKRARWHLRRWEEQMSGTHTTESSAHQAAEAKACAVGTADERETREKTLGNTVADSFPANDPPSTLPDPTPDSF